MSGFGGGFEGEVLFILIGNELCSGGGWLYMFVFSDVQYTP